MYQKIIVLFCRKEFKYTYYKKLIKFYKFYTLNLINSNYSNSFQYSFNINQHCRQLAVDFYDDKIYNYTTGLIAVRSGISVKHYKRLDTANSCVVLYFQKILKFDLTALYLLKFNNFNLRSWKFFQKLDTLVEPLIYYLIISKSYNVVNSPEKRIKRRVLANLKKL